MDRRAFLKASVAGLSSSFVLGGISAGLPREAKAANLTFDFTIDEVMKTVTSSQDVLTWQYVNAVQPGPGALNSSIVVNEGDVVTINIQNNLTSNHSVNLVIPGLLDVSAAAAPGAMQTYTFTATTVGSYCYFDNVNGLLGKAMGLVGPLVVLPVDGSMALTPGLPNPNNYNRDYVLLLHEIDSRINDAIAAGLTADMNSYQPNFFFVNGLSYPDTVFADPVNGIIDDTKVIYMLSGEDVSIRLINGGLIYYPMHFHGYHVNVINRNRVFEEFIVDKDTVLVKPDETVETILNVGTQLGLYPLHTHFVPGVTTAGKYAGGGLLMMKAV